MATRPTKSRKTAKSPKNVVKEQFLSFADQLYKDVRESLAIGAKRAIHKSLLAAKQNVVGQSVAVLGPPAAGKTTLLRIFQNPAAEAEELTAYEKTEVTPTLAFKVNFMLTLEDGQQIRVSFKVKKNADVGGEEYIRDGNWKDVVRDAAIIVYVVDWPSLTRNNDAAYRDRVHRDFDWLLQNSQLPKPGFKVVLLGNKIDELCSTADFRAFRDASQTSLDSVRRELIDQWPDHLMRNIGPALLISLRDKSLRQFTLNALMLSFVGVDMHALLSAKTGGANAA